MCRAQRRRQERGSEEIGRGACRHVEEGCNGAFGVGRHTVRSYITVSAVTRLGCSQSGTGAQGLFKYRYGPQPVDLGGQRALDFVLDNPTLPVGHSPTHCTLQSCTRHPCITR